MSRLAIARLLSAAVLLALLPVHAEAQLGALKRLKNKVSPDSATKAAAAARDTAAKDGSAHDSAAIAAALAAHTKSDSAPQRSRLKKLASAAASASAKFEDLTGVSATDAALAATGVGAGNLVAKKLGIDPSTVASRALAKATGQGGGTPSRPSMSAMSTMPGRPGMAATPAMGMPTMRGAPSGSTEGISDADMRTLEAFQQEMMRVSTAASRGDPDAEAKLERLQTISLKYQPEMQKLSTQMAAGDVATMRRLQAIQFEMMREWLGRGAPAKESTSATKPKRPTP